jgi:hypothetical protein
MANISVTLPTDGTTADVTDVNTPINTIVNEFNGNIDNTNIKSGAAIDGTKLADNTVTGAKSTVFPVATDRQDIAANSTASDPHIQYGWTYVTGDGSNKRETISITFPTAFDSAPIVLAQSAGLLVGSNPAAIGDLVTNIPGTAGDIGWLVTAYAITTSGCTLSINSTAAFTSTWRLGIVWVAIGAKAR